MNMDMMKFIHLEAIAQIVAAIILDIDLKIFIQLKRRLKKIRKKKHIGQMQMLNKKKAKIKIKDKLNKDINEKKLKINILKSKINKSLKERFEYIYQLAMNNKELNAIVLSEDKEKYGYSKQILKENMEKKNNQNIIDLFIIKK